MHANHPLCRAASGSGSGSVSFRRYRPPREIRSVVESVWTFSAGSDGRGLTDYVLPDIGSEIICRTDAAACIFLRGPQFQLEEIAVPSYARYVGARLRPGVASWFLGVAAKEVCGSRTALEMEPSEIAIDDAPGDVVKRLVQALIDGFRRRGSVARATIGTTAADIISSRHGKISADAVAAALGCSTRHLRRQMIAEIGMGPKAAARIARIRRAVALLGASDQPLAQVALDAGYGDQAHMTREFAALKAPTPATIRRWRESDFAKTPAAAHR
jgi:AraC-like DNA-binding protein